MDHETQRIVAAYLQRRRRIRMVRFLTVVTMIGAGAYRSSLRRLDLDENLMWLGLGAVLAMMLVSSALYWRLWRCPVCDHWLRKHRDPEECPFCQAPFRFARRDH